MASGGLVIHIEAGADRHTEVQSGDTIRIGTGEDCAPRLQSSVVAAPFVIEMRRFGANGSARYRVTEFRGAPGVTHNGAPLKVGATIADGDEVRVPRREDGESAGDLTLQFFALRGRKNQTTLPVPFNRQSDAVAGRNADAQLAPFSEQAALESAQTARRDDAKVFLREFTRELVREINPSTKIITLLIVVALVAGVLYLGFAINRELRDSRRTIGEQNQQLIELRQKLEESQNQFQKVEQTNQKIIDASNFAPRIRVSYGDGVCIIAGTYIFVENGTGKPLRHPDITGEETGGLTPNGRGAVAEYDFVGTGFHVGEGYVVTNRHVAAQPWIADDRAQSLTGAIAATPRLTRLVAYFPNQTQSFTLKLKQTSTREDLAICQIDGALPENLPVLPLDNNSDAASVGKPVVMLGYPTGPNRILATLPDAESRVAQERYGASIETLLSYLASRKLIRPLMTQGYITDLDERKIVYGAGTAEGGSGSPLFGNSGRVIGVNYAIYGDLKDANFAVPVRYTLPLLQRAGWKPHEATDAANRTANLKEAKASSAP